MSGHPSLRKVQSAFVETAKNSQDSAAASEAKNMRKTSEPDARDKVLIGKKAADRHSGRDFARGSSKRKTGGGGGGGDAWGLRGGGSGGGGRERKSFNNFLRGISFRKLAGLGQSEPNLEQRRPSLSPASLKDGIECFQNSQQEISESKKQMADLIERNRRVIEEFERGSGAPLRKSSAQSDASSGYASRKSSNTSDRSFNEEDEDEAAREKRQRDDAALAEAGNDKREDPDAIRSATSDIQDVPEATTEPRGRRTSMVEESIGFGRNLYRWMVLRIETFKAQKKANEDMRKAEKAMNAVTEMVCSMEDDMIKEEQILALRADELRRQSVDIFKVVADAKSEQVGYDNPTMLDDDEIDSGSRSGYNSDTEGDTFDDVVFDNFDSNLAEGEDEDEDKEEDNGYDGEGLSRLRTLGRAYEMDFEARRWTSEGKLFGMRSLPNLSEIPEDDGFLEHLEMQVTPREERSKVDRETAQRNERDSDVMTQM